MNIVPSFAHTTMAFRVMPADTYWYFDFISPFAYLQHRQLRELDNRVKIIPRPVLFAGLLNHWGQKGPAEIRAKRTFTYEHATWLGKQAGVELRFPPSHPFNPLRALRLSIAMDNEAQVLDAIFNYIWRDGRAVESDIDWEKFTVNLGISDQASLLGQQDVKDRLRLNTEEAIEAGIFGVPTLIVDGRVFWGQDATQMYIDYLDDPDYFNGPEMQRVRRLESSAIR